MDLRTTTVIGLAGASGGLGTSTLAAATARLAVGLRGPALLVDLAPGAGGLDQLTGCAHEPGLRWPVGEQGMLSLGVRDLPTWRDVRVLSQRGAAPAVPSLGRAAVDAVSRLALQHDVTVLDLPRPGHPYASAWFGLCSTVVLVAGTSPPHVGAALAARALQRDTHAAVLRPSHGCGLDPADVGQVLGLPVLHVVPHDPSVPRAVVEQEWPGSVDGPVREAAAAILAVASRQQRRVA
jgi:MinD-like ATPase involved in chromosome partitioning or flagellar assembly